MPGIYISWPFCAQKCTYCNFASGVQPRGLEVQYGAALLAEICEHAWGWMPNTVYLGGGTPGSMPPEFLRELLGALPGRQWIEATMEAAPGLIDSTRVRSWIDAGINRVSLGVQSFDTSELARTGRRHNAQTILGDVRLLREQGIGNINVDLIAGLPAQTAATWKQSLETAVDLGVPHISVYMLEVDEDSRLGSEILLGGKRYGAIDVPDENRIADFYEHAVEYLQSQGIARYEISNFAKPGFESLHNLKYWHLEPYVGFGSDAHSFDGSARWQNAEEAIDYVERWQRGSSVHEAKSLARPEEEKFFVGLRLADGVLPDAADWVRYRSAFERFLSTGMMERAGDRLRLTPRGIMVSNEVFEEFLLT